MLHIQASLNPTKGRNSLGRNDLLTVGRNGLLSKDASCFYSYKNHTKDPEQYEYIYKNKS